MATAAAAIMMKARRDVASYFMSRHAVTADSAVTYTPSRRPQRRMFDRMVKEGVLVGTSSGRWYLDVAAYDESSHKRRNRALLLLGGMLSAVGLAAVVG